MDTASRSAFGGVTATLATTLLLTTVSAASRPPLGAPAADRAPARLAARIADRAVRDVLYDERETTLWARGTSWKMSFDESGATYFPRVGAGVARDVAQTLSPSALEIGGKSVAFRGDAPATRTGEHVTIDRGAFVETYDLALDSVEQSFVFTSLPAAGDLVLRVPLASETAASEIDGGLELRGATHRTSYERAVLVDAHGSRTALSMHVENGAIVLRVEADVLAHAALPLVIDPFVRTVFVTPITGDDFQPDVAYDPFHQTWLVTYEEAFSATDHDVYGKIYLDDGSLVTSNSIDLSTESWVSPRCADCAAAHEFLVVAEAASVSPKRIRGRRVIPSGTIFTTGSTFTIGDVATGDQGSPSVGGDPSTSLPSNYCVAWTRDIGTGETEIRVCTVTSTGVPNPSFVMAHILGQSDTAPSVSKSDDSTQWMVAWRHNNGVQLGDIWGAYVHFDGGLDAAPFPIATGVPNDFAPCASSRQHDTQRFAVAFTRQVALSTNHETMVALLDGTTVLQIFDLNALEPGGMPSLNQDDPSIDSDGAHFLVSYTEGSTSAGPLEVYVADTFVADTQLGVTEGHVLLHQFGLSERHSRISCAHDAASTLHRAYCVYDVEENPTDHDVDAGIFDLARGGATSVFCAGTAANCPCANGGSGGAGCANSTNPNGGLLVASGTPDTLSDSLSLLVSGLPSGATVLFFQGTTAGTGTPFGDGLRCATGTVRRLATKTALSGSFSYPSFGDPSVSAGGLVPLDGGRRTYQAWYRNAAGFCTSATFNLTNGLIVDWAR